MNARRSGCPINLTLEGLRHTPAPKELSVRAKILEDGEPKLWSEFIEELRHLHLEEPAPRGSVFSRLQSAYEAAIAKPLL